MDNLERHLRYEVDLEKYEAKKREIECGKENEQGGMMEGVGQLKATIPARDYFRWQQYKPGCWGDKQFVEGVTFVTILLSKRNPLTRKLSKEVWD